MGRAFGSRPNAWACEVKSPLRKLLNQNLFSNRASKINKRCHKKSFRVPESHNRSSWSHRLRLPVGLILSSIVAMLIPALRATRANPVQCFARRVICRTTRIESALFDDAARRSSVYSGCKRKQVPAHKRGSRRSLTSYASYVLEPDALGATACAVNLRNRSS